MKLYLDDIRNPHQSGYHGLCARMIKHSKICLHHLIALLHTSHSTMISTAKEDYLKELANKWNGKIDERAYNALINYQVEITD